MRNTGRRQVFDKNFANTLDNRKIAGLEKRQAKVLLWQCSIYSLHMQIEVCGKFMVVCQAEHKETLNSFLDSDGAVAPSESKREEGREEK